MLSNINIIEIIKIAIILAVSIGMHEYAHALISYKLGDPTPKLQNRLTPNPLNHIDPIGFLMIFLVKFGRGKPVQINPTYYKKPLQGELMVALAGPAANILLAIIGICVMLLYGRISGFSLADIQLGAESGSLSFVMSFWLLFAFINLSLAVFNLLPVPPLDGFRIIKMFRHGLAREMEEYQTYVSIIFLLIILSPGGGLIGGFIYRVSSFLFDIIFLFFSQVFY